MAAILNVNLVQSHKVVLLKTCLWLITEADGPKHATRYRSEASLTADRRELQHEHVFQLRTLVSQLLADASRLDDVLRRAVACTVTRDEHTRLTRVSKLDPQLDGWPRYAAVGIRVIDMVTGRPLELGE